MPASKKPRIQHGTQAGEGSEDVAAGERRGAGASFALVRKKRREERWRGGGGGEEEDDSGDNVAVPKRKRSGSEAAQRQRPVGGAKGRRPAGYGRGAQDDMDSGDGEEDERTWASSDEEGAARGPKRSRYSEDASRPGSNSDGGSEEEGGSPKKLAELNDKEKVCSALDCIALHCIVLHCTHGTAPKY